MASIPAVKALESRHHARGLRVVSVTRHGEDDEEKQAVAASAKEHGMDYPCFLDTDGSWSSEAGAAIIPAFLLVDGEGRLAYRHVGKLMQDAPVFAELDSAIGKAIEAKKK